MTQIVSWPKSKSGSKENKNGDYPHDYLSLNDIYKEEIIHFIEYGQPFRSSNRNYSDWYFRKWSFES